MTLSPITGRLLSFFAASLICLSASPAKAAILFTDTFNRPDGLYTNEFAFWNPGHPQSPWSSDWELDSGSLFVQGGAGWTGYPDGTEPDAKSRRGNNSAIFRMNTKRRNYSDCEISFRLLNQGLTSTRKTPPVAWDGIHIWMHYQNEANLYYASINRRDGTSIIKKKTPGGPSNGGTYYDLSQSVSHPVRYGQWVNVRASVRNNSNGSVTISLYENDRLIVSAVDNGSVGGPPIRGAGRIGLRGDNANLKFDDFRVTSFDGQPSGNNPTVTEPNPVPVMEGISHYYAPVGISGFRMKVRGSNFTRQSVMRINGSDRSTQFVSSEEVEASVRASDLWSKRWNWITIYTPGPGGGTSTSRSLRVGIKKNEARAMRAAGVQWDEALDEGDDVFAAPDNLADARVYPNPWRKDAHTGEDVTFDQLSTDSVIKVFTVAGHLVRTITAPAGAALWDLKNDSGDTVASGLYLYMVTNNHGDKWRGKLAVIR
jgi:hypothetical protein